VQNASLGKIGKEAGECRSDATCQNATVVCRDFGNYRNIYCAPDE